jgi:hypothetical protein
LREDKELRVYPTGASSSVTWTTTLPGASQVSNYLRIPYFAPEQSNPTTTYTITLSSTNLEPRWSNTITIQINRPPGQGNLQLYPTTGQSLKTVFKFTAHGWKDPEEEVPLFYQFEIDDVLVNDLQESAWMST